MTTLIPVDFNGSYIDSLAHVLPFLEKTTWQGTTLAPQGSFLGALAPFVSITKEDVANSQCCSSDDEKVFFFITIQQRSARWYRRS